MDTQVTFPFPAFVFGKMLLLTASFSILMAGAPAFATAMVITKNTVWQGEVVLTDDVLVPDNVSLTIKAGTVIKVVPAESTKTDPEYSSPLTEITVRGSLKAEGTPGSPVVFKVDGEAKQSSWAGIIIDGGTAHLHSCQVTDAEAALYVIDGSAQLKDSSIMQNRYGITAIGSKTSVIMSTTTVTNNDYGIFVIGSAKVTNNHSTVRANRKKDSTLANVHKQAGRITYDGGTKLPVGKIYGDEVLLGTTIWQGRIVVNGIIRIPEGAKLAILPGTTVEFGKRDTNDDGIGENGLMIQGVIIAKGTAKSPIIFRSAEKNRHEGDWDAINIMNSDGAQNLIEFCQIENAYHGLHFHFSNVAVTDSVLKKNYRGIQFQESTVVLNGNWLYDNRSGIQGRNSTVEMTGNVVTANYMGGNFFRSNLQIRGNRFTGNYKEGLRLREGITFMEENLLDGNRYGLMVADTYSADFGRNVITNNAEVGVSIKNADNVLLAGNFIVGNGINGLSIQETRADITGNMFAANGERGIGITSFAGRISGNNFARNGLFAIDHEGKNDVDAPANWWGGVDAATVIFDQQDDPARGTVKGEGALAAAVAYVWPLPDVTVSTQWLGEMVLNRKVEVAKGATISILPSTKVAFSAGAGLTVYGKLLAKGEKSREIVFTSSGKKEPGAWDEVLLEHASDSVISHAVFEYGSWGLHSHFTNLSLSNSQFRYNQGGMRFRSGPVRVKGCLFTDNSIGIRSYRGNGIIEENAITGNETGIFVREKGGGLKITKNNLYANSSYNIRIGDFNDEDVNAKGNWWGEGNPRETFFDGRTEPGIGLILYEPFLRKPMDEGRSK